MDLQDFNQFIIIDIIIKNIIILEISKYINEKKQIYQKKKIYIIN